MNTIHIHIMRVLVTGGTGLVGSALNELNASWTFIGSNDCNLLDKEAFRQLLMSYQINSPSYSARTKANYQTQNQNQPKPTYPFDFVIHLAANVGGLFKNQAQKIKMFQDNLRINLNVIETCYEFGIPRMICCLSTCVFPDGLKRVMDENDLHNGEPHYSNYGYAYAKRMIDVHCELINNNNLNFFYQTIIPTNIYGPYDQFKNPENAHVIPALICKASTTRRLGQNDLLIRGSGTPVRQFIYSRDLAKIITLLVERDIRINRLICSPDAQEEHSIMRVAELIAKNFGIARVVPELLLSNTIDDGQYTKTCTNANLRNVIPENLFQFTPIETGIRQTCDWYKLVVEPHVS